MGVRAVSPGNRGKGVDYEIGRTNFDDYKTGKRCNSVGTEEEKVGYHNPMWYNRGALRDLATFARRRKRKRGRRAI